MLTGRYPWKAASAADPRFAAFRQLDLSFAPWTGFTPQLQLLLCAMLAPEPLRCTIADVKRLQHVPFLVSETLASAGDSPAVFSETLALPF